MDPPASAPAPKPKALASAATPPKQRQQQQPRWRGAGLVADPESESAPFNLLSFLRHSSTRHNKMILLRVVILILIGTQYFQTLSSIPTTNNNLAEAEHQVNNINNVRAGVQDSDDTAIIITSSWIPSHPSTYMIEMVMNSTKNLIAGLSPSAPIFITIDNFRLGDFNKLPSDVQEKRLQSLEQYTVNLYNTFLSNPRVHIISSVRHLHIGGSVAKAMNLIQKHFPTVRYLYQLQHDFSFAKELNHTALISTMDEYDEINYVLFLKGGLARRIKPCGEESKPINLYTQTKNVSSNKQPKASPKLIPTATYSDNNHLVRFQWYKATIESIISLARAPENPLQVRAFDECRKRSGGFGLYAYQEENMLVHLDGRHTPGISAEQPSQRNQTSQMVASS